MSDLVTYSDCDGTGWVTVNPTRSWPRDPQLDRDVHCGTCLGAGEIEPDDPADDFTPHLPVSAADFANPRPDPDAPDLGVPF